MPKLHEDGNVMIYRHSKFPLSPRLKRIEPDDPEYLMYKDKCRAYNFNATKKQFFNRPVCPKREATERPRTDP